MSVSDVPVQLERLSANSVTACHSSCQSWFVEPMSYSEEETDFLNDVLLHQDTATTGALPINVNASSSHAATSDSSTRSSDIECEFVVPSMASSTGTVSVLQQPCSASSLKLQLDYSDVISAWEQMTAGKQSHVSCHNQSHLAPPVEDDLTSIRSAQYSIPTSPCHSASAYSFTPVLGRPCAAASADLSMLHSVPLGYVAAELHNSMGQRCMSLPIPSFASQDLADLAGSQGLHGNTGKGGPVRIEKAARAQSCQIRKAGADSRSRSKASLVKPNQLAALQLEAAMSGEYSSSSIFI